MTDSEITLKCNAMFSRAEDLAQTAANHAESVKDVIATVIDYLEGAELVVPVETAAERLEEVLKTIEENGTDSVEARKAMSDVGHMVLDNCTTLYVLTMTLGLLAYKLERMEAETADCRESRQR